MPSTTGFPLYSVICRYLWTFVYQITRPDRVQGKHAKHHLSNQTQFSNNLTSLKIKGTCKQETMYSLNSKLYVTDAQMWKQFKSEASLILHKWWINPFFVSFSKKLITQLTTSGRVWKHGILWWEMQIVLIQVLYIQYVAHCVWPTNSHATECLCRVLRNSHSPPPPEINSTFAIGSVSDLKHTSTCTQFQSRLSFL